MKKYFRQSNQKEKLNLIFKMYNKIAIAKGISVLFSHSCTSFRLSIRKMMLSRFKKDTKKLFPQIIQ